MHDRSDNSLAARLAAAGLALACIATGAVAEDAVRAALKATPFADAIARALPETSPALDAAIADLGSDDFDKRGAAVERITADESITQEHLLNALARPDLTPEQNDRLVSVMRERFFRAERPALGVQLNPTAKGVVLTPQKGFPATDMLKDGDTATSVDGVNLVPTDGGESRRGLDIMRAVIMSHLPGESVAMTLTRTEKEGEKELKFDAPLGRFEDLNRPLPAQVQAPRSDDVAAILPYAWSIRAARMGIGETAAMAIKATVDPDMWLRSMRGAYRPGAGDGIVAGGGRGALEAPPIRLASAMRDNGNVLKIIALPNDGGQVRGAVQLSIVEQMRLDRERYRLRMAEAQARLREPGAVGEQAAKLREVVQECQAQINLLDQQINARGR